jgi:O-antigen/teichoic acid export membrane protein
VTLSRTQPAKVSARNAVAWAAVLGLTAFVAVYSAQHTAQGVVFAGVVVIASILAMRWTAVRAGAARWIPMAWIALMLLGDHRFDTSRTPLDAAYGNVSPENILQIAVYAAIAAMIVHSRRVLIQADPREITKGPILLFPIFALISALWSPIQLFSVTRAAQLVIIASLALLTVRIWQSSEERGLSIWRDSLRSFVQAVTILSVIGLIVHPWLDDRFTWPGTNSGNAATYMGAALLILIVGGRSFAPTPRWTYVLRLFLLTTAIYLARTRSVLGALLVAGLVLLWILGRETPIVRYLGIWYYVLGLTALLLAAQTQVLDYLARGEGSSAFTTLNSRIPLWELSIHDLSQAGRWIYGFGYGAARILLYPKVPWAGTAHNAWIEALLGVGIVGVLLLAVDVFFLLWRLGWTRDPDRSTRIALILLIYLLVVGGASETMVLPGIGFALLALIHVPALVQRRKVPASRAVHLSAPVAATLVRDGRAATYRLPPGVQVITADGPEPKHRSIVRELRAAVGSGARSVGGIVSRLGWGLADQSLSSLTNFALGVVVARSLAPPEFGAFGIAFGVYTMALGVTRALSGEPLIVRFSADRTEGWGGATRAATGVAILVGTITGLGCIVASLFTHGALASALMALGFTMPGLLLQDTWRFAFFSARRGAAAFLNDLVWAIVLFCWLALLLSLGTPSTWWLVLAWGGSGTVAGLFGLLQARLIPDASRVKWWFREQADLIPRFAGEFGVTTLVTQMTIFAIGILAGLAQVGAIRAGQLLLGPLNVVFMGVVLAGVPEAVRAMEVSLAKLRRTCALWSIGLGAIALGIGVLASILPDRLGVVLLGENWPFAQKVVLPLSIGMAGWGVIIGAGIGLRALAAAKLSLRARLAVAPLALTAAVYGAAVGGAGGAAWGLAVAYAIGSLVWWRLFERGMREHREGGDRSARRAEVPDGIDVPEGFRA